MSSSNQPDFDIDALVLELRETVRDTDLANNIRRIMDRVFADVESISAGMPDHGDNDVILLEDETISIRHSRFPPRVPVPPHNHGVSATIGVYAEVGKKTFFRASKDGGIEPRSETDMGLERVLSFGPSAIHSVECISGQPSCGIHVYLGPLTKIKRDLYDLSTGAKLLFTDDAFERLKRSS